MSARVTVDQTATGWRVQVDEGDWVIVETDGPRITVSVNPDEDEPARPLEVALE